MNANMAEASKSQEDIKEGFICPICHKDLRSPGNLLAHFQDLHSEEQDVLKSLKEVVGKVKKKILKLEEKDLQLFKAESQKPSSTWLYYENEEQEVGCIRTHIDFFKMIRRERLDHRTTETNRIILRLDKLLKLQGGADRKHQEQIVVAWLDGTTVTRCPSCASSFNFTKRQHHCRLCGSIMCSACSKFLSHESAYTILIPKYSEASNFSGVTPKSSSTEDIRICNHCMDMLECRRSIQIRQTVQLPLCVLYEQLQKLKCQTQPSVDLYLKMYSSLTSGDSIYQLQDAQSLKSAIAKQAESLDAISKKIAGMPLDPEAPKTQSLQNAIRRATTQYVKDYILTLPILPTHAELEMMKRDKLQYEFTEKMPAVNIKRVAVTTGWSPANMSPANVPETSEDPLIQQINIVRNYIEQARKAQRFEEVVSLQENLRMLKNTYRMRVQSENAET